MAPKESVIRGYDYYRQQRLLHYLWSRDHSTLTAQVQGTRLYAIIFSLDDGFLAASCDCPAWNLDRLCKHVLCACFTTKRLLSPESFSLPDRQQTKLPALRTELLGNDQESSGAPGATRKGTSYEIVIDARHAYTQLLIHRNGSPLPEGWAPALPPELVPLHNRSWFMSGFGEDPLLHYLRQHDRPYRIVLQTGRESLPLSWTPSVTCHSKTEIDLAGDQVRIRARCLADGVALERIVRFRTFVVDLGGGRLLYLEDEGEWASFRSMQQCFKGVDPFLDPYDDGDERLRRVALPDGSRYGRWQGITNETEFTVSLDEFRSAHIDFTRKQAGRTLRDLMLKVAGTATTLQGIPSPPTGEAPSYTLILNPPDGPRDNPTAPWKLLAQCRMGDLCSAPSLSTFSCLSALEQGLAVPSPLRAQKRKAVLYDTFFTLLSVQDAKQRDHRIKTMLAAESWSRQIRDEAYRWLRQHLSVYARPDVRSLIRTEHWHLQPIDKAREALLYKIPFDTFGPGIFRGMQHADEMRIDAPLLFQRLPELLEKLSTAGIELLYEDRPARSARWDCSVQVERGDQEGTGIDWFEIRPEIRCDGVALEEAEWRTALRQGGLIDNERGLRVLDCHSLERLRAILELTGEAQADRGTERIVRVPRLQIFDWLALRKQGIAVSLPAEDEAVLGRLLGFTRIAAQPLPKHLHATLRPYQREGYAWLAFLYEHRFGACLADDMGLGKTLQAICLLAAIKEGRIKTSIAVKGPHLVVVPTSLLFNWEQELARFAPGLKVHVYSGSERTLDAQDGEVVLTTYGLVRRDIDRLERTMFHVILFDEAQAVKNILAGTTGAVRRLRGASTSR